MGTSRISARRWQNRRRRGHQPALDRPLYPLSVSCPLSNRLMSTPTTRSGFGSLGVQGAPCIPGRFLSPRDGAPSRSFKRSRPSPGQQKTPKATRLRGRSVCGRLSCFAPSPPHPTPTTLSHPDFTVGSGSAPDLLALGELAGLASAGTDLLIVPPPEALPPVGSWHAAPHPAPKVSRLVCCSIQAALYRK